MFVSSELVRCVAFDPQKPNILASCSLDKTIKIWNIESGACQSTLNVDGSISSLDFSPCGTKIAAACNDYDNDKYTVKILGSSSESAGTFECKSTLDVDGEVYCVSYSPDGEFIAAGYGYPGNAIQIFKAQTGEKFQSPLAGHRYVPSL